MATSKVVVAEKVFSEFKNTEVWKVAVQVPSGKKYAFKDIVEPLKAIRYMLFLCRKEYATLNRENYEAVVKAHNEIKKTKAEADAEEPKATTATETEKKPKRAGRKTKKEAA